MSQQIRRDGIDYKVNIDYLTFRITQMSNTWLIGEYFRLSEVLQGNKKYGTINKDHPVQETVRTEG